MIKEKILVIDDEPEIVNLIRMFLEKEGGYQVITAGSSDEAFIEIKESKPSLIILDMKLPGVDGREVCRILKSNPETRAIPVIFLTGKYIRPEDKVNGFDLGADDYITKPFYGKELLSRVKAILRRVDYGKEQEESVTACSGALQMNISTHTVYIKVPGRPKEKNKKEEYTPVELTPKEFDLLYLLIKKTGRVLNRSYILETVWGYEYFGTTRTVDVHIAHLRNKLGQELGRHIETVESMGYRFLAEVD